MPFELLVGPPASGKTTRLIARAREAALAGRRVWWVGLPGQRAYIYRRATQEGGVLGLEFLTVQQVAYRMLADALRLRPLIVGTARLVLVGEALLATERAIPAPGEARLFAYAIAEAKRHRVGPRDIPVHDQASERLRDVFASYEQLKGPRWDYDDFRVEALSLAKERVGDIEADLIVVDGFREVGPLDLSLYRELGNRVEVVVALPDAPPGVRPNEVLEAASESELSCYRAKNPVTEARWVLSSLKRDLAEGIDPLDLAVIMPESRTRAFAALADEYGVPVMDETPTALADTPAGRRLADLLALPDAPTPSRLLAVPELRPLARAVLREGVAGAEAVGVLAEDLGLEDIWREWRSRLDPDAPAAEAMSSDAMSPEATSSVAASPNGLESYAMAWARTIVELVVHVEPDPARAVGFREQALRRAKEAAALAAGIHFREWWAALLQEADVYRSPPGGVALLDATRASGRRFARVYLIGAVAGAWVPGVGEDWFIPEEQRARWEDVYRNPGARKLPNRFRGMSDAFYRELLTRGNEVVVTFPAADQEGPLEPAPELVRNPTDLPEVPPGSRLELTGDDVYHAPRSPIELDRPSVERLQRYAECGFRTWAEDVVFAAARPEALPVELASRLAAMEPTRTDPKAADPKAAGSTAAEPSASESAAERRHATWWRAFRGDLLRDSRLGPERIDELCNAYPEAEAWLSTHQDTLRSLTFDVRLESPGGAPWVGIDAARRANGTALIYRFAPPGSAETPAQAQAELAGQWREMWAAGRLLQGYGGKIERVDVRWWSILGSEIDVYEGGITYAWRRVERAMQQVAEAYERFASGDIEPRPGFICRSCVVADVCREGMR